MTSQYGAVECETVVCVCRGLSHEDKFPLEACQSKLPVVIVISGGLHKCLFTRCVGMKYSLIHVAIFY